MSTIRVSIHMLTYNHESYIRAALDSVFSQKCDFLYEVVIGDDCSTDGTTAIVEEYIKSGEGRIRLLVNTQNIGMHANYEQTLMRCRGEYVAFLEGDDYWTNTSKLATQVVALDAHQNCVLCCHGFKRLTQRSGEFTSVQVAKEPFQFLKINDFLSHEMVATCTAMCRRNVLGPLLEWQKRLPLVDFGMWARACLHGDIIAMPGEMAVRRVHKNGVWSALEKTEKLRGTIDTLVSFNHYTHQEYNNVIRQKLASLYQTLVWREAENGNIRQAFNARAEGKQFETPDRQMPSWAMLARHAMRQWMAYRRRSLRTLMKVVSFVQRP